MSIGAAPSDSTGPMQSYFIANSCTEITGYGNFEQSVVLPQPGVPVTAIDFISYSIRHLLSSNLI